MGADESGSQADPTTPCHCNCVTFCPMHGYSQDESPYLFIAGWTKYGEPIGGHDERRNMECLYRR